MSDKEPDSSELTEKERDQFARLPRELKAGSDVEDGVVTALRAEGYFARRSRAPVAVRAAAAAGALIAVALGGGFVGGRIAARTSLEGQLARDDLSLADRVLLLQRAGSAYVTAAHAYADATAKTDSTAVEVARQVLLGAAHAVVRSQLDAGIAERLTSMLQSPVSRPTARTAAPILWF
jgi:hypothetical protein